MPDDKQLRAKAATRPQGSGARSGGSPSLAHPRGPLAGGSRLRAALPVSLVSAVLVLPPLGQRVIGTSDEVRFALLAKDMIERGAWFDIQLRDKQYRNKPPLYPWAIAGLSILRGRVTEATAQIPVAVPAIGGALFTFLLGDRLFDRRTGLWAGLIVATSYSFFGHSQLLLPDLIVVCFGAIAGYTFCRVVADPPGRRALVAFYAALALGVFAKGLMGLLALLVAVVWLWSLHGVNDVARRLWSPAGTQVFAGVTLLWLAPYVALGAGSFGSAVVWQDWLAWYLGIPAPGSLGNLAVDVIVGFLPWTLVAPLAIAAAVRSRRDPAVRFALLWFAVPLVVIMLAQNQRTRYLHPLYPGAALLVAWSADAQGTERTAWFRAFAWLSLAATAAGIVALGHPEWFGPEQRPFVPGLSWTVLPLAVGAALGGTAPFWGLRLGRPALLVHGVVAAMVVILSYGVWLYNSRFNELTNFKGLAATIENHAQGGLVDAFGGRWFSIDFYLGRPLRSIRSVAEFNAFVAGQGHPVVAVNGRTWRAMQGQISPDIRVLEEVTVRRQPMLIVTEGDARDAGRPRQ